MISDSLSPQKSEKKFVENVVEIDEKYVDREKHQMVTYIIGKAYNKKIGFDMCHRGCAYTVLQTVQRRKV